MERETEDDFERLRQNLKNAPAQRPGLTRLGADMDYFRNLAYPCSPEREAEIERLHRQEQKRKGDEYRAGLVSFASECVEGKKGRANQELADEVFRTVEVIDLLDRQGHACPENCSNLVLWDLRRRVAWMAARARGEMVPERLKSREECLAIHNARKFADERFADNDPVDRIPPMPDYGYRNQPPPRPQPSEPEQETLGDWAMREYG
jgi:hypothetical protein